MTKIRIDFALAQDSFSALGGFFRTQDSTRRLHTQTGPGRTVFKETKEYFNFDESTSIQDEIVKSRFRLLHPFQNEMNGRERALRPDLVKDEHSL